MFSDDIKMEFGLDKCAKATFKKGKLISANNIELDDHTSIKDLDQDGTYRYLGVDERGQCSTLKNERKNKEGIL